VGRLTGALFRGLRDDARSWSSYAALAGVVGASCSAVLIGAQPDPWSVNWPFVVVPLLAVPLPLLVASRALRVAAALVMALWCLLGGYSLGIFFVPCVVLMIGAARRDDT